MNWLQLKVSINRDNASKVEAAMLDSGALSVTLEDMADQPILEPAVGETPLWEEVKVTGLYDAESDTRQISVYLNQALPGGNIALRWEQLEDRDWEREWIQHYQPIQCAENLWICPSWKEPPDRNATNLMLDPGLAFGTGTHPTTFLCLAWLARQELSNKSLIDYGCGSGILAIAGLLLGAGHALCVDNDPQALLATADNASRNAIAPATLSTSLPDQHAIHPTDFLIANILAEPLMSLAEKFSVLVKRGGKICLSGILASQADLVMSHYQAWFDFDPLEKMDDWVRITGTRK